MSVNLLDLLKSEVTSKLLGAASSYLGAPVESTEKALGGIMPSILGAMINKGSSTRGAEDLMGMLANADGSLLDNIGDLFGTKQDSLDGLMTGGGDILGSLLGGGNKASSLIDMVAKLSGLNSGMTGTLLKLAAPFIMSAIGKKVKSMAIDAIGLTNLLGQQKSYVADALPAGFGGALGFADMLGGAKESMTAATKVVGDATSKAVHTGKSAGSNLLKWLLPALLGLLVIGYFGSKGCNTGVDIVDNAASAVTDVAAGAATAASELANQAVGLTGDALKGAFSAVDAAAKEAIDKMSFTSGSVGDQMDQFIDAGFAGDNRFTFRNLTFETGSAALDASSQTEVNELAAILRAYTGVKIAVEGYTDNTGDAASNEVLSLERAEAVKAALVATGIDAIRIATAGYGSANPVASNDTEDGKAQNRRIEVRVIQ